MKQIFRAQDAGHVEKEFIEEYMDVPGGWYASRSEALANYRPPEKPMQQEAPKRGPGRPRKEKAE